MESWRNGDLSRGAGHVIVTAAAFAAAHSERAMKSLSMQAMP
jgi:hypothetical protein